MSFSRLRELHLLYASNNRPALDELLATQQVTTFEEWYDWKHEYLTSTVKNAFSNEKVLGLALQSLSTKKYRRTI